MMADETRETPVIAHSVFFDEADYRSYNEDPRHVAFVERRWKNEVESFQEIDYVELG
jgi:hypothetical protein